MAKASAALETHIQKHLGRARKTEDEGQPRRSSTHSNTADAVEHPGTAFRSGPSRLRPLLLLLLALVLIGGVLGFAGALGKGLDPFGPNIADDRGCFRAIDAPPVPEPTQRVVATDKTLLPLGVICQESTVTVRGIKRGPIVHFQSWPYTALCLLSGAIAAGSTVALLRLLLRRTPKARWP